jgi:hypothetical protein
MLVLLYMQMSIPPAFTLRGGSLGSMVGWGQANRTGVQMCTQTTTWPNSNILQDYGKEIQVVLSLIQATSAR